MGNLAQLKTNVMDKILTAKEILEGKGYTRPKFDMVGFAREIAEWFKNGTEGSGLLLAPYRLSTFGRQYECGYANFIENLSALREINLSKIIPSASQGAFQGVYLINKGDIDAVASNLSERYGYIVEKGSKGTYLVSLI